MKNTLIGISVCLIGMTGIANAAVIDDFSLPAVGLTVNGPQTGFAAGISSAGYARSLDITTSGTDTNVQINTGTNPGRYAHSQSSGVFGTSTLTYTLPSIDLTDGGTSNALRLVLLSTDLNGILGVSINGIAQSLTTNAILTGSGLVTPAYVDFLYSSFTGLVASNATTVSFTIDGSGTAALDASVANLGTACSGLTGNGAAANARDGLHKSAAPSVARS